MSEVHADAGASVAVSHPGGDTAFLRAADWLGLAAAPTFALMAWLSGVLGGGPADMPCSAAHGASSLNGMMLMFGLMSAFHSASWLKWMGRRRCDNGFKGARVDSSGTAR